jgi:polyferredoxin
MKSNKKMRFRKIVRRKIRTVLVIIFFLFLLPCLSFSQVRERIPKPDFQTDYVRPDLLTPSTRSPILEYMDVFVLVAALAFITYSVHKHRSRRTVFLVMIFSLVYFGFYRKGCVCSIGAIQNVSYAFFDSSYAIPLTVIAFFVIPLVFTLFYGRTFCAAVCPLGAIQDVVVLKPVKVRDWLADVLSVIPYIYLGLAILFATTGAGFIICQYDPFIGFFRFGGSFNMIILGMFMLLLGTVVARPYCRFFCPYSVLLNWMSRLSKRHVKITPNECNNCRLCEESCPFGAITKPVEATYQENKRVEVKKLALLFVLLPFILIGSGWIGSRLNIPLSRQHFTVSLAEEIILDRSGQMAEMTDPTLAFRASGKPTSELFAEAHDIQKNFKVGGWILGGFIGLVICLKLINLSIRRKQLEYDVDKGTCLSCARCFSYCPYEQVRLGIITPEEAEKLGQKEVKIKQFRA